MAEPQKTGNAALTDDERRAVRRGLDDTLSQGMNEAHLFSTVEQIIAARVAAAKGEIADELHIMAANWLTGSNEVSKFIDADHAEDVERLARRLRPAEEGDRG